MADTSNRPERKAQRRSGRDRRSESAREEDRRKAPVPVAVERRAGTDRRKGDRRTGIPRRLVSDRRKRSAATAAQPGGRGGPASRLGERDRERAHRLPDEVAAAAGSLEQRLAKITRQMWPTFPLPVRAGLIEALLPVLGAVTKGQAVTDDLRRQCEELVGEWIGRYR